jgi:DeoR/GlpR family transcriptional regulator of sugar metabolism
MMLRSTRHEKILNEIQKQGTLSIAEIARLFDVSEITIYRDLEQLDRAGKLKRVRGGARRVGPHDPELPVIQRQLAQVAAKRAIGNAAVELIKDGEIVAIESGSTTLELARAIARQVTWNNLQVVTNSFTIFETLFRVPGIQLVFLGGIVVPEEMGTFGIFTEDMLKQMTISKTFLGCRGIDPKVGLSNSIQAEMEVSTVRAFANASLQTIVLADHTKFGKTFLIHMLSTQQIDAIVTDAQTEQHAIDELTEQDIRVYIAGDGPPPGTPADKPA